MLDLSVVALTQFKKAFSSFVICAQLAQPYIFYFWLLWYTNILWLSKLRTITLFTITFVKNVSCAHYIDNKICNYIPFFPDFLALRAPPFWVEKIPEEEDYKTKTMPY